MCSGGVLRTRSLLTYSGCALSFSHVCCPPPLLLLPILDDGIFGLRCEDYSWMGVFFNSVKIFHILYPFNMFCIVVLWSSGESYGPVAGQSSFFSSSSELLD